MSTTIKVALGIVLGGFLLCGGLLALLWFGGMKLFETVKEEMELGNEWTRYAVLWRGPSKDVDPAKLFPAQVNGFALANQDDQGAVSTLDIQLPGRRATYQSGGNTVELFAWRATNLERDTVYKRVIENVKQGPTNFQISINAWLKYSRSNPTDRGVFWGNGEWLFLARTVGDEDMNKFLRAYTDAIAEKPGQRMAPQNPLPSKPAKQ